MKCWCFNQEQFEAAVREYIDAENPELTAEQRADETRLQLLQLLHFLDSDQVRKHKLGLHGIWDRQDHAPVVATPTGTLDPKHEAEGRN